ncbi:hypothetical protein J4U00_gp047 [Mycobacterium phage DyoEdafos]|uniref:Uncharacterized protein n=1 Tax=Mycobacterium phage DyoEdafos TaxID=2599860 RepID=A0A5J6TKR2_9CAUD|nr:hypothetical protein J4U00_gp047 [Mycobacterium phage DyoEdafos]QFG10369.1 hypothetical protein SEA_DYOEDAFOS_47 [Mycobacterium phage DyoEdafos]
MNVELMAAARSDRRVHGSMWWRSRR